MNRGSRGNERTKRLFEYEMVSYNHTNKQVNTQLVKTIHEPYMRREDRERRESFL